MKMADLQAHVSCSTRINAALILLENIEKNKQKNIQVRITQRQFLLIITKIISDSLLHHHHHHTE